MLSNIISFLTSNTKTLCMFHCANYVSSYYQVSKSSNSFVGKVFVVQVEWNRWQRAPLSNSSSSLYTSSLPFVYS
jgi:hypothetical protein